MIARGIPRLHLIGPLGRVREPDAYAAVATDAVRGGVEAVHVRMPGSPGGGVRDLVRSIRVGVPGGAAVIVNDRIDVALLLNAEGVHLGERSLGVAEARRLLPEGALIGRSIHDVRGAEQAESDGADYVMAGHIFDTGSKAGVPGRGLIWLAEVVQAVSIPVIAIGGITAERTPAVIAAGASGVAVGREILESRDAAAAAARIRSAIDVEKEK